MPSIAAKCFGIKLSPHKFFKSGVLLEAHVPFSRRNNFLRAVPIRVRNEAPESFRIHLLSALGKYVDSYFDQRELVFVGLEQFPPSGYDNVQEETFAAVLDAEWYRIYDVVEALYRRLADQPSKRAGESLKAAEFRRLTNAFFEREGFAYKLNGQGHIEIRGDEAFEAAVDNANIALKQIGATTARAEIHKALEDLAKRPAPDLTGAIQHAMAGLECVANQIVGTSGIELGKLVKSRPEIFPPPLNEVIPKLYGYASNNGRHLTEGQEPLFAEAELLVGIAATVSTYLARKLT